MGKSERSKARATAWKWFSLYIRLRDCKRDSGQEWAYCITCGTPTPLHKADAGHFVSGRSDAVLFDEHNCHLQCQKCNRFKQGEPVRYEFKLRDRYSLEEVERLKMLTFKVLKLSVPEFRDIADMYRLKCKELQRELNE